jgi:holo-[acyl-carrier protein] synthase
MPPKIFIGTDIVDISRIREVIADHPNRFIQRTYTNKEQLYCKGKADPVIHYAGRFAAKEAVKKALMTSGIKSSISWVDMEIISGQDGEPIVQLHGKPYTGLLCKVSISHTQDTAIATAIIVK